MSRLTRYEKYQGELGDFHDVIVTYLENGKLVVTVPTTQTSGELEPGVETDNWVRDNLNTNAQLRKPYD